MSNCHTVGLAMPNVPITTIIHGNLKYQYQLL